MDLNNILKDILKKRIVIKNQKYEIVSANNKNKNCISLKNCITGLFLRHYQMEVFDSDSDLNPNSFEDDSSFYPEKREKFIILNCSNINLNKYYIGILDDKLIISEDAKNIIYAKDTGNNIFLHDECFFEKKKKQILFLACLATNYGSTLQSVALYNVIKSFGYDCRAISIHNFRVKRNEIESVDHSQREYRLLNLKSIFEFFIDSMIAFDDRLDNITNIKYNKKIHSELLKDYDAFVCGSDQIWKPDDFWMNPKVYLQFSPKGKRVAYAPSIAFTKIPFQFIRNIPKWKKYLLEIDYISCREQSGSKIIQSLINKDVKTVIDPSLLLSPKEWIKIIPNGSVSDSAQNVLNSGKKYLFAYVLDSFDTYKEYITTLAHSLSLDIIWIIGRDSRPWSQQENIYDDLQTCWTTDPAGFVKLIQNASFVCTDSFHGTCFSLNFSKPFVLLTPPGRDNDPRMEDMFLRFGVQKRIIKKNDKIETLIPEMDYTEIQKNIQAYRDDSLTFLRNSLDSATLSSNELTEEDQNIKKQSIFVRTIQRVPLDDPKNCTGCGACQNICPHNAIEMLPDVNGFLAPQVKDEACIRCGKCLKRCPLRSRPVLPREKTSHAYAAWCKNPFILFKSASGGMFPLMASWVFSQKGVAYGVSFDDHLSAHMTCASSFPELEPLCGSKYVQAETGLVFRDVKKYLEQGIPVLFSGTSCQVGGLYAYLEEDHPLLITVDLICGGVPSPLIFKKYCEWREQQLQSKIHQIQFRSKIREGWGLGMVLASAPPFRKNYFSMNNDEYGILYNHKFIQRPSCAVCRFRGLEKRIADVTIGDFWGIGRGDKAFLHNVSQGVSVVLPNSAKGRIFFECIASDTKNIFVEERTIEEVVRGNPWLVKNFKLREESELIYASMREKGFGKMFETFFGDPDIRMNIKLK